MTVWPVIVDWIMVVVGGGSVLLGIVGGAAGLILGIKRRLQRPAEKP